jgi:hypothetical protein
VIGNNEVEELPGHEVTAKRSSLGLIIGSSSTYGKVFDAKGRIFKDLCAVSDTCSGMATPVPAIYAVDEHLRYGMIKNKT